MVKIFILISALIFSLTILGQDTSEYNIHFKSINETCYPGHIIDRCDTVFNANKAFLDYTIDNLILDSVDRYYISNRGLLHQLKIVHCDNSMLIVEDTSQNGSEIKLRLLMSDFNSKDHDVVYNQDSSVIDSIDGCFPYGGIYPVTKITQIDTIQLQINSDLLHIPRMVYSDLYTPNMCLSKSYEKRIELFESINGENYYLYIYGGINASSYYSKLVFNKKGYVTRIIANYIVLSRYRAFGGGLIGF